MFDHVVQCNVEGCSKVFESKKLEKQENNESSEEGGRVNLWTTRPEVRAQEAVGSKLALDRIGAMTSLFGVVNVFIIAHIQPVFRL